MFKNLRILSLATGVLIIGLSAMTSSSKVQAHELISSGNYYALLHTEPRDEPEAGQPSVLKFAVNKHSGTYNQTGYNNQATISKSGRVIAKLKVNQSVFGNASDGSANYTFATSGTYDIVLHGVLKTDPNEVFDLHYSLDVTPALTGAAKAHSDGFGTAAIGGLIVAGISLIGVLGYMFIPRPKEIHARQLVVEENNRQQIW